MKELEITFQFIEKTHYHTSEDLQFGHYGSGELEIPACLPQY